MNFRPDPKPERREKKKPVPLKRTPLTYKRKPTGEAELFAEILNERGRKSEISGTPLYHVGPENFIHILAKGQNKYPRFKLLKRNIVIGTAEEHREYDFGLHEKLRKLPEWKRIFELREQLIDEYKNLL